MIARKAYFVREHVGFLKLSDTYDVLDPETGTQVAIAKERAAGWVHVLRFLVNKRLLPTAVHVYEGSSFEDEGRLLFSIRRGFSFLRPQVEVMDRGGAVVGTLRAKVLSLGGAFSVLDPLGNEVASVKGDWKGWNFRFLDAAGRETGSITKKWAGIGKELFTSADNYMVSFSEAPDEGKAVLLLAAALAVDTVYKEH